MTLLTILLNGLCITGLISILLVLPTLARDVLTMDVEDVR